MKSIPVEAVITDLTLSPGEFPHTTKARATVTSGADGRPALIVVEVVIADATSMTLGEIQKQVLALGVEALQQSP